MFEDFGRVSADHAEGGDVFGHHASTGNDGVFADGDAGGNDRIGADPAVIFDRNLVGGTLLIPDRDLDIGISVIKAGDADMLGHNDIITDGHGAGQHTADADHDVVADNYISDAIVNANEVLYDRPVADDKFPEGGNVYARASPDNGAAASMVHEAVDEDPCPPAGSCFALNHEEVEDE